MENENAARPLAVEAASVPIRAKASGYPEPFASRVRGRTKRVLGDLFGLKTFGVNLTTLPPGAQSALMHNHSRQDEMVYILQGRPTLRTDRGDVELAPGMCAGFPAGGLHHHLVNATQEDVVYLEIGDRTAGDRGDFPADDIKADIDADGKWVFTHKDGTRFD